MVDACKFGSEFRDGRDRPGESGVPSTSGLSEMLEAWKEQVVRRDANDSTSIKLPDLVAIRDSAHHVEDRIRLLDRRGDRITTLWRSQLRGLPLCDELPLVSSGELRSPHTSAMRRWIGRPGTHVGPGKHNGASRAADASEPAGLSDTRWTDLAEVPDCAR